MNNILIIKTNATGDVVRTTVLLHLLKGNIYWITDLYNIPVFPEYYPGLELIPEHIIPSKLFEIEFDLLINLEENEQLAQLVNRLKVKKIIGVYWADNKLLYTADSAHWFDMSLISTYGKDHADFLKRKNSQSYQEIIFSMLGKSFNGEHYLIRQNESPGSRDKKIGLETRVGKRWPNKYWQGFKKLEVQLRTMGYEVSTFQQRTRLQEYLEDISSCKLIICGDTLAMHVALGYHIPVIGIFTCTSPTEIFGYGVLRKVISPLLEQFYYSTTPDRRSGDAVTVEEILREIQNIEEGL